MVSPRQLCIKPGGDHLRTNHRPLLYIIGERMKSINWANIAIMTVVVVTVLWAATIVCLLWEIREYLSYIALGSDATYELLDMIWGEISWNITGEYMIPLDNGDLGLDTQK